MRNDIDEALVAHLSDKLADRGFNRGPKTCEEMIASVQLRDEVIPPEMRSLSAFSCLLTHELIGEICARIIALETTTDKGQ